MVTLNLKDSTANSISANVLWVTLRNSKLPVLKSTPGLLVTSWLMRQARFKNFNDPAGDTSAQSTSSSGGPAKTNETLMASTPCLSNSSDNLTKLPRLLLIAEPSINTMPWFNNLVNGSLKFNSPISFKTLVKNLEYKRCKMAWVTPPTY